MAENKSIFPEDYGDELQNQQIIVYVRDKRLASCLIAVGIPLRKDPPYIKKRKKNGSIDTIFHFYPADNKGHLKTNELIKAWSQDLEFIKNNPLHPFTFAMCAIRNYQCILEHLKNQVPYVVYGTEGGGRMSATMVKEGSRKHEACKKRGMKQI